VKRIALIAGVFTLLVSACAATSAPTTTTTPPATTTTTFDATEVIEQATDYVRYIRGALIQNDYSAALLDDIDIEQETVMVGLQFCATFTIGEMVDLDPPTVTGDTDFDSLFYFAIVASAVTNFCPENEDSLGYFISHYNP